MGLTEQQKQAVETSGTNILVSAGAGSGKTKVLTERVFDRILNPKYHWDIDQMLILTFTNAAAQNMKVRIRDIIQKNESGSLSEDEQERQLNKIDSSFIMTFDAFAQFLVKKYHLLLDVDSNINIIDPNILRIKNKEFLDEIMDEYYQKKDPRFLKLLSDLCVKDDENVTDIIIELDHKLNTFYQRDDYVKNYEKTFFSEQKINEEFEKYTKLLLEKVSQIKSYINELSNDLDCDKYYPNINDLLNAESYQEIKEYCDFDIKNSPRGLDESIKKLREKIKNLKDQLKKMTSADEEMLKEEIRQTKDDTLIFLELAQRLNKKMSSYKKENNLYDFSDIFSMSISLVDNFPQIREEIKNQFKEILVDEYQDTNDLQDEFIKRISNHNVYMVGDIKQSIYRFRDANPSLFKKKYEDYKEGKDGAKIDLTKNFRSRKEVLDGVNEVFKRVMDLEIGGAEYQTKEHTMEAGNDSYKNEHRVDDNSQFKTRILSYTWDKDTKKEFPFNKFTKIEVESFLIAKDIEDKINSGFRISSEKGTKPVQYSDFTILVDRKTDFEIIKSILLSRNIPAEILTDENLDESELMPLVRSSFKLLCKIVDYNFDYDFKYAFISLARSFAVRMSDAEIYNIFIHNSFTETELYKKLKEITHQIETKNIHQILNEIFETFDIYQTILGVNNTYENFAKIDYLYQLADSLNSAGYTYRSFNDYLKDIFENSDQPISYQIEKGNSNSVKITNIHQSKGLEYPICYFIGLTKKFNDQDKKKTTVFSKDGGLAIQTMIPEIGLKNTIRKSLYVDQYNYEALGEEIRLFYVALTRAKEQIILVCPLENKDNGSTTEKLSTDDKLTINNFSTMLNMVYGNIEKFIEKIDFNDYQDIICDYRKTKTIELPKAEQVEPIIINNQMKKIEPILLNNSSFSKKPGLISKETKYVLNFGTKLHYYLETLDFIHPNYELIPKQYHKYLSNFLNSELMKNIDKGKTYREYEFIYQENNETKHGFIDLLVEYDDYFDIIDYKTKNIDDEHYDEQLNGYRKYIESISDKKVNCYLYSICESTLREVEKQI